MTVDPKYSDHAFNPDTQLDDIVLDPVIKSNWKTKGARDYWSGKLSTFISLVPEFVRAVVNDPSHPRDAFIFDSTEDAQRKFKVNAGQDTTVLTNKEAREDRPYKLFTSYTNAVSMIDGGLSQNYLIVAKNPTVADEVSTLLYTNDLSSEENYQTLAGHFGYPQCCADKHWESCHHEQHDPTYKTACDTQSTEAVEDEEQRVVTRHPDPFLNPIWRYHGFRFSYHLPCSYECEQSGQLARTNYEIYKDIAGAKRRDAVDAMLSWLSLPTYLSVYHGLTHIKNAYAIGSYHTDNHWEEKELRWIREHSEKPELEVNHPTTQLEDIDPEAGAL